MATTAPPVGSLDEREPLVPSALRARIASSGARLRGGWSPADSVAAALVSLHLAVVSVVVSGGGFYLDDFRAASQAASARLTPYWLVHSPQTHFAPAQRLVVWLHTAVTPLDHTTATVVTVALQLLADAAVWLLLRTVFGARRATLLPLGFYLLTPMNLPVAMWWAQAVSLLPVHAATAVAAWAHVRYVQTGRGRYVVAATSAFAIGLLFWERALLFLVVAVPLTLLVAPAGRRADVALRSVWRAWAAYVGTGVLFLLAYLAGNHQHPHGASVGEWAALLGRTVADGLLPGLAGGPWHWRYVVYLGIADPTVVQTVAAAAAVALVAAIGFARHRRRTALALAMLAAYVLVGAAMVGAGRLADFGSALGRDYRYLSDASVVAALAGGFALLPLAGEQPGSLGTGRWRFGSRALALALAAAFVAGAVVSDVSLTRRWHQNPARAYVDNVARAVRGHHGVLGLYDTEVPPQVLPPLYRPYTLASRFLAPLHADVRFGGSTFPTAMLDDHGRPVAAALRVDGHSDAGPGGSCGWPLRPGDESATVPLESAVPHLLDLTAQVELITDRATPVEVAVVAPDGRTVPVEPTVAATLRARRGLGAVVARLPRSDVAALHVRVVDPRAHVCVTGVYVGRPLPLAQLSPSEPVR